jgi:hypothetical protein
MNMPIYRSSYEVFILIENNYEVLIVDIIKFALTGYNYASPVKINISPKLTKLHYQYLTIGIQTPLIVIKNINYDTLYVYDVTFID